MVTETPRVLLLLPLTFPTPPRPPMPLPPLTVLLPLMFVYGATAAVYGRGALDGLGVESLKGQGGMSWYVLAPCVLLCPCGL